jgi:hypothetical protein
MLVATLIGDCIGSWNNRFSSDVICSLGGLLWLQSGGDESGVGLADVLIHSNLSN